MCIRDSVQAVETKQLILVFTNKTLHAMKFIGPPFTFGLQELSKNITIMSPFSAIAVEDAKFSAPEIHRGLWPHMVMAGLFRVMPKRAGLDFVMRGKPIDAMEAERLGLINKSVSKKDLDQTVSDLAKELSSLAPGTMQFGLEAYEKQDSMSFDEALPFLQKQIAKTFEGPDAKEGIAAFLEKRDPNWD